MWFSALLATPVRMAVPYSRNLFKRGAGSEYRRGLHGPNKGGYNWWTQPNRQCNQNGPNQCSSPDTCLTTYTWTYWDSDVFNCNRQPGPERAGAGSARKTPTANLVCVASTPEWGSQHARQTPRIMGSPAAQTMTGTSALRGRATVSARACATILIPAQDSRRAWITAVSPTAAAPPS